MMTITINIFFVCLFTVILNHFQGLMDNEMGIVDFRRRGSHYECTTISSIKNISERVSTSSIDLHETKFKPSKGLCHITLNRSNIYLEPALHPKHSFGICGSFTYEPSVSDRTFDKVQICKTNKRGQGLTSLEWARWQSCNRSRLEWSWIACWNGGSWLRQNFTKRCKNHF